MSGGDGEQWISPVHFFDIVAAMRLRAQLQGDLTPLTAVDVANDGGTSYLEAIVTAVDEARTMIAASLEVAGRALVVAGTRVIDADMVEEGAQSFWGLASPYGWSPPEGVDYDEWGDTQRAYYDDLNEYMRDTYEDDEG